MKLPAIALSAAFSALATAAEISWTVHDITGKAADISTDGTLVAAHAGPDSGSTPDVIDGTTFEVNGVPFDDNCTIDNPSHNDTLNARGGIGSLNRDHGYYELLRCSDRQNKGDATITFDGLTVGNIYQIQLWVSDTSGEVIGDKRLVLGNGTDLAPEPEAKGCVALLFEASENGPGQFALGTFTADATTQSLKARLWKNFSSTPVVSDNTSVNAVQLRDLGPGAPPAGTSAPFKEVKITRTLHDKKSDRYFLEWESSPGDTYGIYLLENAGALRSCVAAAVSGTGTTTSFGPFNNPRPGNSQLTFEIGPADLTPPACIRSWGAGSTISLQFSEAMRRDPALNPANYSVTADNGSRVLVTQAAFHPGHDTVVLTTAQPLAADTGYSVTMRNLTDSADLALRGAEAKFRTWDDNPNGVRVFILAGSSNMVGYGQHDKGRSGALGGPGSLWEQVLKDPTRYGQLVDDSQRWFQLPSIMLWWNRAEPGSRPRVTSGPMTVGYGATSDCIGPEFGFAWALHQADPMMPVLVIKTAWDRKSLHGDFCSPSAAATRDGRIGPCYLAMIDQVHQVLDNLDREVPLFQSLGYQICGFGWHQGSLDRVGEVTDQAYEDNLALLIRDLRAEFGKPKLPVVIAASGQGGPAASAGQRSTLAGQLAVGDPRQHPQFAGTVTTIDTRPFHREASASPKDDTSRWHANGETFYLIGKSMGDAMLRLSQQP